MMVFKKTTNCGLSKSQLRLLKLLLAKTKKGQAFSIEGEKVKLEHSGRTHMFDLTQFKELFGKNFFVTDQQRAIITSTGIEAWRNALGLGTLNEDRGVICSKNVTPKENCQFKINLDESPLSRLFRLKDKTGKPYISHSELEAGERLRRDFECAGLQPRISANLVRIAGRSGKGASCFTQDISDFAIDARARFEAAINSLGPELSGVVQDICCFLKGLEIVERERMWPPRSAKLMLKTGLAMLARHYGILRTANKRKGHIISTGVEDFRPSMFAQE